VKIDKQVESDSVEPVSPHMKAADKRGCKMSFLTIFIVVVILVWVLASIFIPTQYGSRRPAWQSRAKGTLRSIGSSQLAYKGTNHARNYGSFEAMKHDLYVAEGYTLGNMIENYSMTWEFDNGPKGLLEEDSLPSMVHTFTIIAFPRDRRPGYLSTFAITEDQVVRVYNPDNGNDPGNVKTWDPIL